MSTEKVVGLNGQPVTVEELPKYNTVVADVLEGVLKDVKAGKVTGVGMCIVYTSDDGEYDIDTAYVGRRLVLIAGASRLSHHLNLAQDGHAYRVPPEPPKEV